MKPVTISKSMIKFWSKFHIQMLWYSFTWDSRFLQTPSLISTRKILPPAPLDIKNSLSEGMRDGVMKVQFFRELLKGIFIHQKKKKKKKQQESRTFLEILHEVFFRHLHEMFQPSGQDQQNDKRTYCRLPPQSFRINFKDTPSHISIDS